MESNSSDASADDQNTVRPRMADDPLGRSWIELTSANPELVSSFRRVLLGFHTTDNNVKLGTAGTGFILGDSGDYLVFATARHVVEYVKRLQKPHMRFDGGYFAPDPNKLDSSILNGRLKVTVSDGDRIFFADVVHLGVNDANDVVLGMAEIPQEFRQSKIWRHIPLGIVLPNIGDPMHICSFDHDPEIKEIESDSSRRYFEIERRVTVRKGVVTEVYPRGFNQYQWPCFTTSIPASPGMSGGFAYSPTASAPVASCGIVCVDLLAERNGKNYFEEGRSLVACSFLALTCEFPSRIPPQGDADFVTIYDMVMTEQFPKPVGDFHRIHIDKLSPRKFGIRIKPPV
jgi:hypothetical protein